MASGSRTVRYHGDGHQLSSSGSRHRGNWHDGYSPLWSEYLLKEKHGHEPFEMIQNCTCQLWFLALPRLSNIFWMVVSLASTITRLSSNIRTFMDNHLEDIHSGWSTQQKKSVQYHCIVLAVLWNENWKKLYWPSGINGVGGFIIVQPAFLNISIWKKSKNWYSGIRQTCTYTNIKNGILEQDYDWSVFCFTCCGFSKWVLYLVTWAIRVWKHQSWSNDIKSGINVHRVRVLEWDDVDVVVWAQVATHPFNSHVICNL